VPYFGLATSIGNCYGYGLFLIVLPGNVIDFSLADLLDSTSENI